MPPSAQTPPPFPPLALQARIDQLPGIVNGAGNFSDFFGQHFRTQVPQPQFDQISKQFRAQFGLATRVEAVTARLPHGEATVKFGFEKGIGTVWLVIDAALPHQ